MMCGTILEAPVAFCSSWDKGASNRRGSRKVGWFRGTVLAAVVAEDDVKGDEKGCLARPTNDPWETCFANVTAT